MSIICHPNRTLKSEKCCQWQTIKSQNILSYCALNNISGLFTCMPTSNIHPTVMRTKCIIQRTMIWKRNNYNKLLCDTYFWYGNFM